MSEKVEEKREDEIPGKYLAVTAESLYLLNLLVLPGIAFLILTWLYFKYEKNSPALASCHLRQSFSASIWAGLLLLLLTSVVFFAGGYTSPYLWVVMILYFTICHSSLIIFGIFALVKALAGEKFHYPVIGPTS
jgi:uncharacterized membrane protein